MKLTTHVHLVLKTNGGTLLCPHLSGVHNFQVPGPVATTFCMVVPYLVFVAPQYGIGFVASRIVVNLCTSALCSLLLCTRGSKSGGLLWP